MAIMFRVGVTYETQAGNMVRVIGRSVRYKGYETLECSDGKYRYDRSDHSYDAGRVTGTAHDYSHPTISYGATEMPSAKKPQHKNLKRRGNNRELGGQNV